MATLITGGAGFVGLAVAELLLARGERAVLFDRAPPPSLLAGAHTVVVGDIRDPIDVGKALHGVDKVIHAAAMTPDAESAAKRGSEVRAVNVDGTETVLNAALDAKVKRFVHVSSAAVYGPSAAPIDEADARTVPVGGYGASKFEAERSLLRIAEERRADAVCARLGAIFGPWERRSGVRDTMSPIWQVTGLARRGEAAVLPRPGRKDWLYSRDAAEALVALRDHDGPARRIYNVGGGSEWTVTQWCDALLRQYPRFRYRIDGTRGVANVRLHGDEDRPPLAVARIAREIGFRPRFGLEAAFADYMAWLDTDVGALSLA